MNVKSSTNEVWKPFWIPFVLVMALVQASVYGAIIPGNRLPTTNAIPWQGIIGVQGGIPTNRTHLIDVTKSPYNADKTGTTDATPAIQDAINAAQSNDVVYLPEGTYLVNGSIYLQYNQGVQYPVPITLRGAGTNTIINCHGSGGYAILVGSGIDYDWSNPATGNIIAAGGLVKGSTNVTITDTSGFIIGGLARIFVDDNTNQYASPVTLHVSSWRQVRGQMVLVTAKTANTLTFWPPIYDNYNGCGGRVCGVRYQASGCGIEDLKIEMTNAGDSTVAIQMEQIVNCWIKNVTVRHCHSYNLFLWDGVFCEARHNDIAQTIHTGNNGSGIKFDTMSGSLIEDNLVQQNFPSLEMNFASSGNVIAYNFWWDTYQTQSGAAMDSNHGPHNSFNLYEGNMAPNLQCDGYFGSTSDDTVFRNWLHGTQPETLGEYHLALCLNRFTRNYNVVGNLIGTNGCNWTEVRFGDPNIGNWANDGTNAPPWPDWPAMLAASPGNGPGAAAFQELDTNVQSTTLLNGNYYFYSHSIPAEESLGANVLMASYYLSGKPTWWPGSCPFPPIDPLNPGNASFSAIPAGYRFVHGIDPPANAPTLAIQQINSTTVRVLWPSYFTGWTLWQNTNLGTTNWSTNGLFISDDSTNKSITNSLSTGNMFFRLSNP